MTDGESLALSINPFMEALPRYAEEGDISTAVAESELIAALTTAGAAIDPESVLILLRQLFLAVCILDKTELALGKWAFVSYPASLLGMSICATMGTPGQQLFGDNYWRQGRERPNGELEEQRSILHALETRRVEFHPKACAPVFRRVYVAWGIVRFGDQYLLRCRDDWKKRGKDWGFPGGRLNTDDLPAGWTMEEKQSALARLARGEVEFADQCIERTLKRELGEEFGFPSSEHYVGSKKHVIESYRAVAGSMNKHAYTEYRLTMYDIRFSAEGEARLLQLLSNSNDFEWFSLADLLVPEGRLDGKKPFIDALRANQGNDLQNFLESVADSRGVAYRKSGGANAVDIPADCAQPFFLGSTRHGRDYLVNLNASELALLTTVAAYGKDLQRLELRGEHLKPIGGGWIYCTSPEAQATSIRVAQKLDAAKAGILLVVSDVFVRLAIEPQHVYFSDASFHYAVENPNLKISLNLATGQWADFCECNCVIPMKSSLVLFFQAIQRQGYVEDSDKSVTNVGDIDRELRELIDFEAKKVGLRKIVRKIGGEYRIAAKLL